jgi:hypothetical protein
LKIYFDRGSVQFVNSDTTKTPGFISEFHYLVSLGGSLEWLGIHLPNDATTARIENKYEKGVKQMEKYFARRFNAKVKTVGRAKQSYK